MHLSIATLKSKISNLPKFPGVYEFRDKQGKILYIGKATSLKDRVGSYFLKNAHVDRPNIEPMISQIAAIKIHKTDSVLEALILESNLIKKHQPKYNIDGKDDKSFAYVAITKEYFPRVLVVRERELEKFINLKSNQNLIKSKPGFFLPANKSPEFPKARLLNSSKLSFYKVFGPYTSKRQLEIALKLIRKIFPYHSAKQVSRNCCFDFQIGLCPGPYAGAISKKDYLKNIHGIEMILQGKKKNLLVELKKQMKLSAKNNEFEKAAEARNRIFALEHIRDVALISDESTTGVELSSRIEAYDISNIGGDYAVGSMIVFSGRQPDKKEYRKFKIKTVSGIDDVGMMREVLCRRFNNSWPKPDLILLDGGKGHLNMAQKILADFKIEIPIIAVAKGPTRKKLDIFQSKFLLTYLGRNEEIRKKYNRILSDMKLIERIRNEAHRFAINYHKKLRSKNWKEK
jgi:excinuclease ABC subunit C